jgi:hypothetical protein
MTDQGPDKTIDAATTKAGPPTATPSATSATAEAPTAVGSTTVEVVDVTADGATWTDALTRSTTEAHPIRASKRVAKRKAAPADAEKGKKGKKKLVRGGSVLASPPDMPPTLEEPATTRKETTPPTTADQPGSATRSSTRQATGFDLTDFMSLFQPGLAGESRTTTPSRGEPPVAAREPHVAAPSLSAQDKVRLLRQELAVLRGQVAGMRQSLAVCTDPNDQGKLLADSVRELTSAGFPEQAKKAKGDYPPPLPPQTHVLAATRMFKGLTPAEGKPVSPRISALVAE